MAQAEQVVQPTPAFPERRIIERPRLLKQLEETDARTILLVAPAGYGKTTLARQWAAGRNNACWYAADAGAADLAQLAIRLSEVLDRVQPGLRTYIGEVVRGLRFPARQCAELAEAFETGLGQARRLLLVIDDYHYLAANYEAESLIDELRRRLDLRLFVGSRTRPAWADARRALYGDIIEFGVDEL
ncbi:MAG: AAA family ATPase, partial [Actinobacteria bacterium]|nr:AAA family ATPase [Actinomycetota bacterium]